MNREVKFRAISKETKKKTLKELLLEFESNQLEGKGYDFYFVIRTKLDELLKQIMQNNMERYLIIIIALVVIRYIFVEVIDK